MQGGLDWGDEVSTPKPFKSIGDIMPALQKIEAGLPKPKRPKLPVEFVKKVGKRTERGDLLTYFTQRINAERAGTKYKPLSVRAIAVKVGHLSLQDLYYLKSVCDSESGRYFEHPVTKKQTRKSFSMIFFGSLKVRK